MRKPITIAYVEDGADDVHALRAILNEWHVVNEVVDYPTGELLLRSLVAKVDEVPGIVLVDMAIAGGMDGFAIIRALRLNHASTLPLVPLVIVTGSDDKHSIELAKMAGADAYIVKPMSVPALMKAINQAAPFGLEIIRKS